jgi:hypothetical protein
MKIFKKNKMDLTSNEFLNHYPNTDRHYYKNVAMAFLRKTKELEAQYKYIIHEVPEIRDENFQQYLNSRSRRIRPMMLKYKIISRWCKVLWKELFDHYT